MAMAPIGIGRSHPSRHSASFFSRVGVVPQLLTHFWGAKRTRSARVRKLS